MGPPANQRAAAAAAAAAATGGAAQSGANKRARPGAGAAADGKAAPRETVDREIHDAFHQPIADMLYGFGDAPTPSAETVGLVEDIVVQYLLSLTQTFAQACPPGRKPCFDDLLHAVRSDPVKFMRAQELRFLDASIQEAKKPLTESTREK